MFELQGLSTRRCAFIRASAHPGRRLPGGCPAAEGQPCAGVASTPVLWRDTLTTAGIMHRRTRPYRPQTNGKVERFNHTLLDEWAYAKPYRTETERRQALAPWLHTYNHHRRHTALAGPPPASPVPNRTGQYTQTRHTDLDRRSSRY